MPDLHRPIAKRTFLPLLLLGLVLLTAWAAAPSGAAPAAPEGRMVVLGFDGADFRTAAKLADGGQMPELAKLRERGTFAPLGTTWSAESPVAWAALNTGQNPSKTGVPGFVKRSLINVDREEVVAGGNPEPRVGHQNTVERPVSEMDAGFLISTLSGWDANLLSVASLVVVFLCFLLAFKFLLRLKTILSVALALMLGVVGALGIRMAKSYVPDTVPGVIANPLLVDNFWEVAARAGVRVEVIDAAMAWDRPTIPGAKVLGGLGLPDCRGENGQWFIYTTDQYEISPPPEGRSSDTAGTIFRIDDWRDNKITTDLYGPKNFYELARAEKELAEIDEQLAPENNLGWKEGNRLRELRKDLSLTLDGGARTTVPMIFEKQADGVKITIGSQTQEVKANSWSDWFRLTFELNPLIKAAAVTRVRILEFGETFTLYVNRLDIDPADPQFWQPVSQPADYSVELAGRIGKPFETFGWACATMPFKDEVIDAVTMLEDIEFTMGWREELTRDALERGDWDMLFSVFSTPDRVQHMCYQFYDPQHPLYDAEKASHKMTLFGQEIELREAIPTIYRQIDRIIGLVTESLSPEDTLIICADHGFQSFRHQVHLNNWLAEAGYLKVRDGVSSSRLGSMLMFVDWAETRAYAMGLGMIYLNLEGREAEGIVDPAAKRELLEEIRSELLELRDPREGFGEQVVETVTFIDDVHDGPARRYEGDLMVGFKPNYRVSWGTTSGGTKLTRDETGAYGAGPIFQSNTNNWSGGHVSVSPQYVNGIFACNRKVEVPAEGVHLLHIAPTVLSWLGVEALAESDKEALRIAD